MEVYYKKERVDFIQVSVKESIYLYISEIEIITTSGIDNISEPFALVFSNKDQLAVYPVRIEQENDQIIYTCWPVRFFKLLTKLYGPINIQGTVEDAAAALGIEVDCASKSIATTWSCPELGINDVMKFLEDNTQYFNGGGVCVTYRTSDKISIFDLYSTIRKEPQVKVTGRTMNIEDTIEWMLSTPGSISRATASDNGVDNILNQVLSAPLPFKVYGVASDENQDVLVNRMQNDLYKSLCTSKKIVVAVDSSDKPLRIGQCVSFNKEGTHLVVLESNIIFPSAENIQQIITLGTWSELLKLQS